jgi:ribulose-phosphate 3-epimerase
MIYPAILSDSPEFVQSELERFSRLNPRPQAVQIDIIDGQFTDNITIETGVVNELTTFGIPIDLHLMTVEPIEQLEEIWGNRQIRTIIAQIERMSSVTQFVSAVGEGGWHAGLSLDLYTPVETLADENLDGITVVQVMGGEAGVQHQELDQRVLQKISELAEWRVEVEAKFAIFVDIGVTEETASLLYKAGADGLMSGSYLQGAQTQAHWETLQKQG